MAISAVLFDFCVEVEISGQNDEEFRRDLERFKTDIHWEDRQWDDNRRVWKIKNYKQYTHPGYIQKAVDNRRRQPPLF